MARNYEQALFSYIDNAVRYMKIQPLVLGGAAGSGGGVGGPPGGIIGFLPQTKITYDESELETLTTASGASLLDNLNHIRYRIADIEATVSGGIDIKEDGVVISENITTIDFQNVFEVVAVSDNEVAIRPLSSGVLSDATYSGVYGENLTAQVNGVNTTFTTTSDFLNTSLSVYLNGLRQKASDVTILDDNQFTLNYIPISGDILSVDYQVVHSGFFHTHAEYALSGLVYTQDEVQELLADKADYVHYHVEADITDLTHDAVSIWGVPVTSGISPSGYQVIQFNETAGEWQYATAEFEQQILFSIGEGDLANTGVKPYRVYVHDVGSLAEITEIFAYVGTPPASTDLKLDVLKNGSTIFDYSELTIPTGNSTVDITDGFLSTSITKGDYFQIQVLQGDTTANYLTVHIRFKRRFS